MQLIGVFNRAIQFNMSKEIISIVSHTLQEEEFDNIPKGFLSAPYKKNEKEKQTDNTNVCIAQTLLNKKGKNSISASKYKT